MAPSLGLLATLRAISLEATDALVETLHKHRCVSEARLVCKDLRQIIDGSVQSLKLTESLETLADSAPPSLALWPRVENVCYCISTDDMDENEEELATEKWISWAGSQPPASLRKITSLRLYWSGPETGPVLTASLAACIALWFPNLKVRFPHAHPGCYAPVRRSQDSTHARAHHLVTNNNSSRIVVPPAIFSS